MVTTGILSQRSFSVLSYYRMHVSRMCEDRILWSTKEFDFVELGDESARGVPHAQKKNPDALELMRGASGIITGTYVDLTTMKGLPLSYNRDMQWDKQPLFHPSRSYDTR